MRINMITMTFTNGPEGNFNNVDGKLGCGKFPFGIDRKNSGGKFEWK